MAKFIIDSTVTFAQFYNDHVVIVQLDNGNVMIASTASPYFCFELEAPEIEDVVRQKVEAAFALYNEAKQTIHAKQQSAREK